MGMSCIEPLLRTFCYDVETRLKPQLRGLFSGIVQGYLPQSWIFETEAETVTFSVDSQGNAQVRQGGSYSPDVSIRWKHDLLASVLRTRNRASIPGGIRPIIMFHTPKGRKAFNFLRVRLGL